MSEDAPQVPVDGSALMSAFNFTSKYARYRPDLGRRESFSEAVDRMLEMHLKFYGSKLDLPCVDMLGDDDLISGPRVGPSTLGNEVKRAFDMIKDGRLLASQRALQFGGDGVLNKNMRIYNCATSYCDRIRFFSETFYMLLCGCGVGFSVQSHHVAKLPPLSSLEAYSAKPARTFTVPDTIEGWAEALLLTMLSFFEPSLVTETDSFHYTDGEKDVPNHFGARLQLSDLSSETVNGDECFQYKDLARYRWRLDFSGIREKGAPLSTGGKAPGSKPLIRSLEKIEEILTGLLLSETTQEWTDGPVYLSPIHCYDIVMHVADAVLSGGVRRSATIALFDPEDEEMRMAKTGNWHVTNPQRARSNNSAVLVRSDPESLSRFKKLMAAAREFGEPGFLFVESTEHIYNPCVEIGMCPVLIEDPQGNVVQNYTLDLLDNPHKYQDLGYKYTSGWQTCNLTEINATKINSLRAFEEVVKAATLVGTLQAGYTGSGYLKPASTQIIEREALLGVSMTGIMDNPEFALNPDYQKAMAQIAVRYNKIYAKLLGLNPAARVTCVKPAGNSSVLLQTSSGIHPHHSNRYIRRVQVSRDDPVYQHFREQNPHLCEESVWSANKTDDVIAFPVSTSKGAIVKGELNALEFLQNVRSTQASWVTPGTARPESCEGLRHNVSNTCEVASSEWGDVGRFIYSHRDQFSGLSFLGKSGDYIYRQAPMQRIVLQSELMDEYGADNVGAARHILRHIETRYGSLSNIIVPLQMVLNGVDTRIACQDLPYYHGLLWETYKLIRNLFHLYDSDGAIHLLSCINHERLWNSCLKGLAPVDYSLLKEDDDLTSLQDTVACGGGACELSYTVK